MSVSLSVLSNLSSIKKTALSATDSFLSLFQKYVCFSIHLFPWSIQLIASTLLKLARQASRGIHWKVGTNVTLCNQFVVEGNFNNLVNGGNEMKFYLILDKI